MTIVRTIQVLIVAAMGFLAATLLHRSRVVDDTASAQGIDGSRQAWGEEQGRAADPPSSGMPVPGEEGGPVGGRSNVEDAKARMAANVDEALEYSRRRTLERLRNAGFSDDRIAWLDDRSREISDLKAEYWRKRAEEGRPAGPGERAIYMFDKDLDLEAEIGEDEYVRYRQAQGRTTGVAVVDVGIDTAGKSSGLLPGDEIVRYDGSRVYNAAMLAFKAEGGTPGGVVSVEVRRQGRPVQLTLPSGPLSQSGIRTETAAQGIDRAMRDASNLPR